MFLLKSPVLMITLMVYIVHGFMARQADLSTWNQATCIQVTVFFPLGVWLASREKTISIPYNVDHVDYHEMATVSFSKTAINKFFDCQRHILFPFCEHLGMQFITCK